MFPPEHLDGNSHSVWPPHPPTPQGCLASWRQQSSLSSAWTQAYKSTKCSLWVARPVTLYRTQWRDGTFASENMGFASCSALWSILVSWQQKWNWMHLRKFCGRKTKHHDNYKNCCSFSRFLFWWRKKAMIYNQWSTYMNPFVVKS